MADEPRRYIGICDSLDRYPWGSIYAYLIGVGGACGLNNLYNFVAGNNLTQNGILVGLAAGLGCWLASEAHGFMNEYLSERNVGLTRGSRIVKKVQAAVFAVPVTAALAFNIAVDEDPTTQIFSEFAQNQFSELQNNELSAAINLYTPKA